MNSIYNSVFALKGDKNLKVCLILDVEHSCEEKPKDIVAKLFNHWTKNRNAH